MAGGKHLVAPTTTDFATELPMFKAVMYGHPNHLRPGFSAPALISDGTDLPAAYRREAQRLLSLGELGTQQTRHSLIELARLYDALAAHVEARDRAEIHDHAS